MKRLVVFCYLSAFEIWSEQRGRLCGGNGFIRRGSLYPFLIIMHKCIHICKVQIIGCCSCSFFALKKTSQYCVNLKYLDL